MGETPELICDPTVVIAETAVVGVRPRALQEGAWAHEDRRTFIAERVEIGQFCLVEEGVRIGAETIVDSRAAIGAGAVIGQRVLLAHGALVGARARIGDDTVIGGAVADRSIVGAGARIMGTLIHAQLDPSLPWDAPESEEPSPVVQDGGFVGVQAKVIGPVVIGARAYVCAGALVTRDVPSGHIAFGTNQIVHPSDWNGRLGKSNFFSAPPRLNDSSSNP